MAVALPRHAALDLLYGIFPFIGQGVLRFPFIPAPIFTARPLHLEQEGRAQISRCASGAGGRPCQSAAARRDGAAC